MKVIILDTLIKQYENKENATNSIKKIKKELITLSQIADEGKCAVVDYLTKGNDGKLFKGTDGEIRIFKYDLSDGDRILYTYGNELNYLSNEDKDSIVLISYSNHDNQERIAKRGNYLLNHSYIDLNNYLKSFESANITEDFTEQELDCVKELLFSEYGFKAFIFDESEIDKLTPDDIDKKMLLSVEQKECLEDWCTDPRPLLITGGAGTGKTIMAVHLLHEFDNLQKNCFSSYFTQSKELLKRAKENFIKLSNADLLSNDLTTNNDNVYEFNNINEYCVNILELSLSSLVTKDEFVFDFCEKNAEIKKLCAKSNITFFEAWIEIRGVIKGSMNEYWQRKTSISQQKHKCVKPLVQKGCLIRSEADSKRLMLPYTIDEAKKQLNNAENLTKDELKSYANILKDFERIDDEECALINENDYYNVSDEISIFSSEQKKPLYKIAQLYQKWLDENGYYDENDIARKAVCSANKGEYDLLIVDEVQDYTEVQLYLLYSMCPNKNNIVFAGDIHQVINPTVFNHERLKKLFLDENKVTLLDTKTLRSNFRCQQGIIDTANLLSELRRKVIGRKSEEFEAEEYAVDPIPVSKPFRIQYDKNTLKTMLNEIMKYPRIAVLVSDEKKRDELIALIGEKEYVEYDVPFIFKISEIKGMEYRYIFCIDLFNDYINEWNKITENNFSKKRETKYRFYFNLVYVALTRAQSHFCFVDKNTIDSIDEKLQLEIKKDFNQEECYFNDLGDSLIDWYEQGKTLFNYGDYERALKYYKRAGEYVSDNDIYLCKLRIAEEKKQFDLAVRFAFLIGDLSYADSSLREIDKHKDLKRLTDWYLNPISDYCVTELIEKEFSGFNKAEIKKVYSLFLVKAKEKTISALDLEIV